LQFRQNFIREMELYGHEKKTSQRKLALNVLLPLGEKAFSGMVKNV
ncbi:hypothetical protein AVEN_147895-1, partial [Araneus ventricosus]